MAGFKIPIDSKLVKSGQKEIVETGVILTARVCNVRSLGFGSLW